jgi:hypothetical protein
VVTGVEVSGLKIETEPPTVIEVPPGSWSLFTSPGRLSLVGRDGTWAFYPNGRPIVIRLAAGAELTGRSS